MAEMMTTSRAPSTYKGIELLAGPKGFYAWKLRVGAYLEQLDVEDALTAAPPPSGDKPEDLAAAKLWKRKNATARCVLLQTMATAIIPQFEGVTLAKTIWDSLARQFTMDGGESAVDAYHGLVHAEWSNIESLLDFFVRVRGLRTRCAAAGRVISDLDMADFVLHALEQHQQLEGVCQTLRVTKTQDLDCLYYEVNRVQEKHLKKMPAACQINKVYTKSAPAQQDQDSSPGGACPTCGCSGQQSRGNDASSGTRGSRGGRRGGQNSSNSGGEKQRSKGECFRCRTPGHFARDCRVDWRDLQGGRGKSRGSASGAQQGITNQHRQWKKSASSGSPHMSRNERGQTNSFNFRR